MNEDYINENEGDLNEYTIIDNPNEYISEENDEELDLESLGL